jgi:hypothetical protein
MKLLKIISILCLSNLALSTILTDNGLDNIKNQDSQTSIDSSYSKLLQELQNFDYSQTIVKYIDTSNPNSPKSHTILPKNSKVAQKKIQNMLKSIQNHKKNYIPLSPGAILNISIEFINSLQHHIVSILYERFKSFTLPMEVEVPGVTISHIHVNLEDLKVENLNLYLSEPDNAIMLGFSDLTMEASADIKIEKFMIKESGSFSVKLLLNELIVKAIFTEEAGLDLMTPQISVELVDLDIPSDYMDVKLKLNYIPSILSNFLVKLVKGTVIDKIKSFLIDFMPNEGSSRVNAIIKSEYPNEIDLYQDQLKMSSLLTSPVQVKSDRLMINIDALSYAKSKGKGKRKFPSHMMFSNDDGNSIVFGISQEMIETAAKSLIGDIFNNEFNRGSGNFKANFKTNINDNSFAIWESGMKFQKVLVNGAVSYLGFTFDINFNMDLSFKVNQIDFVNKKFFITINKIDLFDYEFKSNIPIIQSLGVYIQGLIEAFGILVKNYSIPCPALSLPYDVEVQKVGFRNENGFMVVKIDTKIND